MGAHAGGGEGEGGVERRLLGKEDGEALSAAALEASSFLKEMLEEEDGSRNRLFLSVAEEQLASDEGAWLCSKVRAESVFGDALLCMPPFLGQLAHVDIIKVRPKAEVDFLRYKVQMWLILRHLHRVLLGEEPSPPPTSAPPSQHSSRSNEQGGGAAAAAAGEAAGRGGGGGEGAVTSWGDERGVGGGSGGDPGGCGRNQIFSRGAEEGDGWPGEESREDEEESVEEAGSFPCLRGHSLQVGQFVSDFEAIIDSMGMHRICSAYDAHMSSWLFRYLLVDDASLLLVAPDSGGALSQGVVTQAVPLKHIISIRASSHNPNLLELNVQDILQTVSATAAGRKPPPSKLMRLSFDSKEMAAESEMFVSQEIAKGWRRRKQDITRLLHLPR